jgi:hypothetical protein
MTAQNLTSPNVTKTGSTSTDPTMTGRLEISDPKIAALFVKDHVSSYLAQFIGAETTVKMAATRAGVKLNTMAYWAQRFAKLGLIRVTRIETRGGSAIKHYQATAEEFIVPIELLEGLSATTVLQLVMQRDYDRFSRSVSANGLKLTPDWHLRLFRDGGGHGLHLEPTNLRTAPTSRPLHDWCSTPMLARDAAVFHQELAALLERFKNAVQHEPGLPRFLMHVGFVEDAG